MSQVKPYSRFLTNIPSGFISILQVLSLVFIAFSILIVTQNVLNIFGLLGMGANTDTLLAIASFSVSILTASLAAVKFYGVKIYRNKITLKDLGDLFLLGLILWAALQVSVFILSNIVPIHSASSETSKVLGKAVESPTGVVAVIVLSSILAPIAEELVFRGTISQLISSHDILDPETPRKEVYIVGFIQAVLFGLAHYQGFSTITDYITIIWTGISGFVFYMVYVRFKNIYSSMLVHSSYNFITSMILYAATRG